MLKNLMWMLGEFTGIGRPHWVAPTGYSGFDSRMARLKNIKNFSVSLKTQLEAGTIIAGTPEQVIPKIKDVAGRNPTRDPGVPRQ